MASANRGAVEENIHRFPRSGGFATTNPFTSPPALGPSGLRFSGLRDSHICPRFKHSQSERP